MCCSPTSSRPVRSRDLTAERAAEILRGIRPRDAAGKTLRSLATDLVAEIRQLDRRIAKAAADIQAAVNDSGTTLTELCGIGALDRRQDPRPGRHHQSFPLRRRVRHLHRHRTDRRLLRRCFRHRLSRAGDRQLNLCLHVMALTQIRQDTPGQGLLPTQTNRGQEPQRSDAMPQTAAIRRRLPTTAPRRNQTGGRPGRTLGGGSIVQRGQLKPGVKLIIFL